MLLCGSSKTCVWRGGVVGSDYARSIDLFVSLSSMYGRRSSVFRFESLYKMSSFSTGEI
jgi:hypothetical protein